MILFHCYHLRALGKEGVLDYLIAHSCVVVHFLLSYKSRHFNNHLTESWPGHYAI